MSKINRLIMLNQMAGPLFREVAEGISSALPDGCILFTGHPDTLKLKDKVTKKLKIVEAPIYDRRSIVKRLFSWLKYIVSATSLIFNSKDTDSFMIVSNPPILGGWFWLLTRFKKRSYCVLVYDIHPDVLVTMGKISKNNLIVKLWKWMNYRVYRDANSVITLGHHMAKRLYKQFPKTTQFPEVISPWADTEIIKPIEFSDNPLLKKFNPDRKKVILYSGNMGVSHDIDSMLEAAKLLKNENDILFLFIGSGEKWQDAVNFADSNNLTNIQVHPFQTEENLPYTMALSSISLVALDVGAEELMVPSKVFYYLSSGSSVIGICQGKNELKDIIENNNCGLCVNPKEPEKLARCILEILRDKEKMETFRNNSRRSALEKYSKDVGIQKFIRVLKKSNIIPDSNR